MFDLVSGAATAPPATADSSTRSQWLTRDAATRLAIRNHLPLAECTHFGQHTTAQALYNAVVARYSSPATAALGRLLLPYLFPELFAFTTVEDLVSHLRASDTRYRAAVPAEFLDRNPPPMYITLYFIVTHLPDSLRSVRDHFLSLHPTSLTLDLLEQHLLAAETSAVAVGAARGTPRPPSPSYASAATADDSVPEDIGAASASVKRCSSKGKGGRGGGGGCGSGGGGSGSAGGVSSGGGGGGGTVGGSGGSGGGGGGSGGSGGSGGGGTGSDLREWFLRGASGVSCPYVIRTGDRAGQTCGRLHTQHRCFSRLDDAWRAEFGDNIELPRWADLLKSEIAIFDLDFDAILSAMYALSVVLRVTVTSVCRLTQVFTSPRSLRTWVESVHTHYRVFSGSCVCSGVRVRSGSRLLLVSPPVAPSGSPLPASPSWHALSVVPKYYSGTVIVLPFNLQACSASGILWGGA
ncbi:unnamed protein product [Closterium sp. NIES-53]